MISLEAFDITYILYFDLICCFLIDKVGFNSECVVNANDFDSADYFEYLFETVHEPI